MRGSLRGWRVFWGLRGETGRRWFEARAAGRCWDEEVERSIVDVDVDGGMGRVRGCEDGGRTNWIRNVGVIRLGEGGGD